MMCSTVSPGCAGADYIDGRGWYDMSDYSLDAANGGGDAVHVDLGAGYAKDGFGDFDVLVNIEHLRGTKWGGDARVRFRRRAGGR